MKPLGIAALLVLSLGMGMKGTVMSATAKPDVTCKPAHAKVVLPDTLCALFEARLAALRPDWPGGAVTLVVGEATARSLIAHIETQRNGQRWQGDPRGAMLSGGQLSQAQITALLDELIAGLPQR